MCASYAQFQQVLAECWYRFETLYITLSCVKEKNKIMSCLLLMFNREKLVFGIHFGSIQCVVNVNCIKIFNRIRYSTIDVLDEWVEFGWEHFWHNQLKMKTWCWLYVFVHEAAHHGPHGLGLVDSNVQVQLWICYMHHCELILCEWWDSEVDGS